MARTYGGRWKTLSEIASGGQGTVFRVLDSSSTTQETAALKWVKNPKRRARFENEVNAIKQLTHPNIIRLMDHSALDDSAGSEDRQFIVMPEAMGGNLSQRKAGFEKIIDSTIVVSLQLASALAAAHAAGVIHRDVKPENVLFVGDGNDVWLTDFGICLIADQERPTEIGEVAGPWAFMAPELEGGGQLAVTPAADIYSLGKVIYYMLSGGIILPRERLNETEYAAIFYEGGRYGALKLLLERMIAPLDRRFNNMQLVISDLEQIASWDRTTIQLPFSIKAREKLQLLRASVIDKQRDEDNRRQEEEKLTEIRNVAVSDISAILMAEAEQAVKEIHDNITMKASSQKLLPGFVNLRSINLISSAGIELCVEVNSASQLHRLIFAICDKFSFKIQIGNVPPPLQERPICVFPLYIRSYAGVKTDYNKGAFAFKSDGRFWAIPSPTIFQAGRPGQGVAAQPTVKCHCFELVPSSWPFGKTHLRGFSVNIYDLFLTAFSDPKSFPVQSFPI